MPTILQVLPSLDSGGVERGTVEIVEALVAAGHKALVASQGGRLVAAIERAGGQHFTLPLKTKNPWKIWRNADALAQLIQAERVDLIHARSRAPAWSVLRASKQTGVPFITTYHGTYADTSKAKRLYNSVMVRGSLVIAASGFIAQLIQQQHGVPPARIRLIPRGVDPQVFDPHAGLGLRVARLATAWGLSEQTKIILLPARISRWKGQDKLIEALAALKRPDVLAVFVGSDQGRHAIVRGLLDQAAARGVTSQIKLVGHCADMPAALMLADVVVSASTQPEAFGRAVIEAQAMERVVIAADHGGAAETVTHGETGILVPPGDVQALTEALNATFDASAEDRQAMGQRARASVLDHYTIDGLQRATLGVYDEVLAGRR
ncbi:glycosyltransferase family 4 protein [Acidisoma cellulosilytica]|uniref:Glycosyltransferase family 4 protein n=1 Tax=Acidisoma cellulosilyticum TaxID=2802395 RepID=A0A964E498_9PROT|nr:glycosyltransferase family 4 protein [Acidisoma cellulosilyticum]MCB8880743.1 glycosyltransferase family 4 protein [Acidisoma cellulosilyticum]